MNISDAVQEITFAVATLLSELSVWVIDSPTSKSPVLAEIEPVSVIIVSVNFSTDSTIAVALLVVPVIFVPEVPVTNFKLSSPAVLPIRNEFICLKSVSLRSYISFFG